MRNIISLESESESESMKKIKDRIILGMLTGTIASAVGQIINIVEHKNKITDVSYALTASKLFLGKRKSKTISGQILSSIINFITAGVFGGLPTTYLLSTTGKDKAITKGIGVWTMQWVLVNGFLSKFVLNVKTKKALSPFLSLFDHIVMGASNAFMIIKLGDNSLFPNNKVRKGEELPLAATSHNTKDTDTIVKN